MLERGSPAAILTGRWGLAVSLVTGAVLIGRIIRDMPYLLPNRLPGLVLHELGPGFILALAIGAAVIITRTDSPRFAAPMRLALFAFAALVVGTVTLGIEFGAVLHGQWF